MSEHRRPVSRRVISVGGDHERRRFIRRALGIVLVILAVIAAGTSGYMLIEGWGLSDALYMTVITISTVGFTEVEEVEGLGRVWTMLLILSGIGTFAYATGSLVELAVEGTVRGYFGRRRMRREINRMNNHHILCGYGRVGREVAETLAAEGISFLIVDRNEATVEECLEDGYIALVGDGSDDEVLEAAGTRRARGLIAAVANDADNVFITLSARKMNPNLHIAARYNADESAGKLRMAGADRTLSPHAIGGRRLASLATHPSVADFLDVVSGKGEVEFRLEEFVVPEDSPLAGRTLGEIKVSKTTGTRVLAIRDKSGSFNTNPTGGNGISPGDTLIVLGTPEQLAGLERLLEK